MINNITEEECNGCGLCVNICPKKCINYNMNEEGFYFPIINEEKCIGCKKCEMICPVINKVKRKNEKNKVYIAINKDNEQRKESSSGGIFYIIANYVIKEGGVIYGATLENKKLKHIRIDDVNEINRILKSKYIQSDIIDIYNMIENDLKQGKKVVFCGTPCQVSAIYKKFEQYIDNLILIDFICHGVPSPGIWDSYIKFLEKQYNSSIENINFRDKKTGWYDFSFSFETNKKRIYESHEINAYMRTFLSDKNIRKSCYSCNIKPDNYVSDITLGDAWKIEKENLRYADNKGTSIVITRTSKGEKIFESISSYIEKIETEYKKWVNYNPSIIKSTEKNEQRDEFFLDYKNMSINEFWEKYQRITIKKLIKYNFKRILRLLKVEKLVRFFK